jgi:membrane-associated phospholipid phosphatase
VCAARAVAPETDAAAAATHAPPPAVTIDTRSGFDIIALSRRANDLRSARESSSYVAGVWVTRRARGAALSSVLVALLGVPRARADEPAPAPNPRQVSPGSATNVPTNAPGNGPDIAPPAPAAPPEKVQEAKGAAKAAELHPIVPSPQNPLRPAFQLYAEIDLPLLGMGLVFGGARLIRTQQAYCAPMCVAGTLNRLDRITAGYWSPAWQTASSVGLYAIAGGAAIYLFADEGFLSGLNDAVVVAESGLAATATASMMTLAASRPRPFLYGDKAPLSARNGPDASLSFLSSHTTVSFALATSTFMTARRLHPKWKAQWLVLGVGLGAASFVGAARVLGGMHFITDVVGGAVVGTSIGVLIPAMHASPVKVIPVVGERERGLAIAYRF